MNRIATYLLWLPENPLKVLTEDWGSMKTGEQKEEEDPSPLFSGDFSPLEGSERTLISFSLNGYIYRVAEKTASGWACSHLIWIFISSLHIKKEEETRMSNASPSSLPPPLPAEHSAWFVIRGNMMISPAF